MKSLYESISNNHNREVPKRKKSLKESKIGPTLKLSDKYVEIDVPKGSITAGPSIAREINSKKPNKKIVKRVSSDGKTIKEAGEKRNRIPRNWKKIDYTLNREASSGKPGDKFTITRDEYGRAIDTDSKGNKYQTNWSMMRSPEMVTIDKVEEACKRKRGRNLDESAEGIQEFWDKVKNKEIKVGDNIPMDNGIGSTAELIDFDGNSDYILIKHNYPNGKGFEYVSAWAPEISNGKLSWGQGHYFDQDLDAAKKHFRSHTLRQTVYESCRGKKKLNEMGNFAGRMDSLRAASERKNVYDNSVTNQKLRKVDELFNRLREVQDDVEELREISKSINLDKLKDQYGIGLTASSGELYTEFKDPSLRNSECTLYVSPDKVELRSFQSSTHELTPENVKEAVTKKDWDAARFFTGATQLLDAYPGYIKAVNGMIDDFDLKYPEMTESCKGKKKVGKSKKLKESIYELGSQYGGRKSYYGKAQVEVNNGEQTLYSYGTPIMKIDNNGNMELLCDYWALTNTTLRHIREFMQQNGLGVMNKKELEKLIDNKKGLNESEGSGLPDAVNKELEEELTNLEQASINENCFAAYESYKELYDNFTDGPIKDYARECEAKGIDYKDFIKPIYDKAVRVVVAAATNMTHGVKESCKGKKKKAIKESSSIKPCAWYENRKEEFDALYNMAIGSENLDYIKEKLDAWYDMARDSLSDPNYLEYVNIGEK